MVSAEPVGHALSRAPVENDWHAKRELLHMRRNALGVQHEHHIIGALQWARGRD